MSIHVTLNCQLKPNTLPELVPFLEENLPNVRGFKGNRLVKVFFNEDESEMLLLEEWESKESHQAYMAFIDGNGVLAKLAAHLATPPSIRYFNDARL